MASVPARHPRVREIDFRRPSKFNREQVRRLEVSHDNFCQSASNRMSAELRTELQLGMLGTDQLPYSVVVSEETPRHAFVAVLRIEELGTDVMLVMELSFALCLVARLLGGQGEAAAGNLTALTDVEVAVAERALETLVEQLSSTWDDLADVTFSIDRLGFSPMTQQIVPPSEPTLLLNMSAQIDGQLSIMTLILPHRSLERIMGKLEASSYGGPLSIDGATTEAVHHAVGGVNVEMRAEVGAVLLEAEEILALKPGDVVSLKKPAAQGVGLYVDEVPAYVASPGRNGNLRAVQVRGTWNEA